MPADDPTLTRAERWLSTLGSVAAPLSLVTAVLFYFGYAASRAEYRYFGVDVDTIGLSTQGYVMRSPQVLLTPVLLLLGFGLLGVGVRAAVRRRVAADRAGQQQDDSADARSDRYLRVARHLGRILVVGGYCALVAGGALIAGYPALGGWPPYPLVTPLLLALGSGSVLYGNGLATLFGRRRTLHGAPHLVIALILTASVFWATATLAEASGRGLAKETAADLGRLPGVILDTTERLYLTSDQVQESSLGDDPGQSFRYRYRGLRLLIQGDDRLFLVPDNWSPSDSTLVVRLDDSVRVQFRFVNDPP